MIVEVDAYSKAYDLGKLFLSNQLKFKEAIYELVSSNLMVAGTAEGYLQDLKSMLQGKAYKRKMNNAATEHYLRNINSDFGRLAFEKACASVFAHIDYLFEQSGQKQETLRSIVIELKNELSSNSAAPYIGLTEEEKSILMVFLNNPTRTTTASDIAKILNMPNAGTVNLKIWKIAEKISPIISYKPTIDENGNNKWWPALFDGKFREDGKFEWTLWPEIESLLIRSNSLSTNNKSVFETHQKPLPKFDVDQTPVKIPEAIQSPKHILVSTKVFERNPEIKEYLLRINGPTCECCGWKSDIITSKGEVYIEIHHLRLISQGGSDSISNTVLLCPNCHKKFHYSEISSSLIDEILSKNNRLVDEREFSYNKDSKSSTQANLPNTGIQC